ncbi:hypothetical protein GCM10027416_09940 [Okibacterium endophyticum]
MTNDRIGKDDAALGTDDTSLDDSEQVRKDTSYSPSSDAETAARQSGAPGGAIADDIDESDVTLAPGTGGPDDTGDVDVDDNEIHLPRDPNGTH